MLCLRRNSNLGPLAPESSVLSLDHNTTTRQRRFYWVSNQWKYLKTVKYILCDQASDCFIFDWLHPCRLTFASEVDHRQKMWHLDIWLQPFLSNAVQQRVCINSSLYDMLDWHEAKLCIPSMANIGSAAAPVTVNAFGLMWWKFRSWPSVPKETFHHWTYRFSGDM